MNITSHLVVAQKISKHIKPKQRFIFAVGSVLPDFDRRTQPHREVHLQMHIFNCIYKIEHSNSKNARALHLGELIHYICDYYCYAHKYNLRISHGILHIKYECEMERLLKKDEFEKFVFKDEFESVITFLNEQKKLYDSTESDIYRDLKFIMSICEFVMNEFSHYII
ncbi:MAG: zinc dependent phospholipase C family protein [Clostridia bacterium]